MSIYYDAASLLFLEVLLVVKLVSIFALAPLNKAEIHQYIQNKPQTTTMCGLFSTIWYETYDLWDALLIGLGGLLMKLGL